MQIPSWMWNSDILGTMSKKYPVVFTERSRRNVSNPACGIHDLNQDLKMQV